jgi:hydrogenase maturation factor
VGADAAVLDMGDRVLVAKSDPVTFAADRIGWYAVQVNANDIACLGAQPRWFLATVLLPEGAPESMAEEVFGQIRDACEGLGVALVGGHTEITYRLERPIVSGMMLGEAERERVVWPGGARPGDDILLTKGIAIEGTALLARDASDTLAARGVATSTVEEARGLLTSPGISVVRDATVACGAASIHAMHDPTEGGLATGLWELAEAAGVGLEADLESVRVLPQCRAVCDALGLDPLGLLASGALLVVVAPDDSARVRGALEGEGIDVEVIGRVTERERGLVLRPSAEGLRDARGAHPLPTFARDELARFLSGGT